MKGIQKRLGSLLMAAVMLLSLAVTPAMAAEEKEPPTQAPTLEDEMCIRDSIILDSNFCSSAQIICTWYQKVYCKRRGKIQS